MEANTEGTKTCELCGEINPEQAKYCSQCGKELGQPGARQTPPRSKWYYNRWVVLILLTPLVLGPFALPLLWKSPKFSRLAKLILTFLTLLWTILFVVYVIKRVVPAITNEMNQLNAVFQP